MNTLLQRLAVRPREEKGQALVILAFAMVGLMAFLGLVTDIGWGMYQKRLAQNGADAAVKAALAAIANSATSCVDATLTTTAADRALTYVRNNSNNPNAQATPEFIDNAGATVSSNPCANATGLRVTATVPYNTFFLRIIGITDATTSAVASGRVQVLVGFNGGAPFVACGVSMVRTSDKASVNILDITTNPPSIVETFLETQFDLHDEQLGQNNGDCDAGNQFKGNATEANNPCPTVPCDFAYQNGNRAGPTRVRVAGLPGCDVSQSNTIDDCYVLIPVANGAGVTNNTLRVVTWACFLVDKVGANSHTGVLKGNCITEGPSAAWTPGSTGPLVLALVE